MHSGQQPPIATTAIIYAFVIAMLVWRLARPQRMAVWRLWFMPILFLVLTVFSVWGNLYASAMTGQVPPPAWEIAAVLILGAVLGIPLGMLRGRHSEVKPGGRAGVMYVHSSPFIIIIWLGAFIARAALRAFMPHAGAEASLAGDGLMAFAMAALITSYYAIYQKYRMLAQQVPAA